MDNKGEKEGGTTNDPIIIISNAKQNINAIKHELLKRGFLIISTISSNDQISLGIGFCRKLCVKLAIENGISLKNWSDYALKEKLRMAEAAIKVLKRMQHFLEFKDVFIAHNQTFSNIPLDNQANTLKYLNDYFGSKIALVFGFLDFYTKNLQVPAVAGVGLFVDQMLFRQGKIDSPFLPIFCVCLAIWSTGFLEFWKRRCAELSLSWDVLDAEDKEDDKELAKSISMESTSRILKRIFSIFVIIICLLTQVRIMIFLSNYQETAVERFGNNSYFKYWPTVFYCLMSTSVQFVLDLIARKLNDFEDHCSSIDAENNLIYKIFTLRFVNNFSAFFYAAYWLKNISRLRVLLITSLIMDLTINNLIEFLTPMIEEKMKIYRTNKKKTETEEKQIEIKNEIVEEKNENSLYYRSYFTEVELKKELNHSEYDAIMDYLELVVQFGRLCMFSAIFPLLPILAIFSNYLEAQLDMRRLFTLKKPQMHDRSNIGAWQRCFEIVGFLAVLTNSHLLATESKFLHFYLPEGANFMLDATYGRLLLSIVLEHFLIGIKVVLMVLVDDVPKWVREAQARKNIQKDQENLRNRFQNYQNNWISNITNSKKSKKASISNLVSDSMDNKENISEIATLKLSKELHPSFALDPINLCLLIGLPWVFYFFGIPVWFFFPAACLFLTYLQTTKDRADRKAAVGIISDPTLIKLVLQEMPSWTSDSQFERIEWFNSILQKMWPQLSMAVEEEVKTKVQPLLDKNCPKVLNAKISLKRFSLGSICPKLVGIRVHDSSGESLLRLDVELRWAGDPIISLSVGFDPIPVVFEVSELRISAVARIELLELIPKFPCFRALSVTFMSKPNVSFSLKMAKLDIMNLGLSQFNLTSLVRNIVHSVVAETALYPKKIVIPMDKTQDISHLKTMVPLAVLSITVERCQDLKLANFFGSDPYVVMNSVDQIFQTSTKYNTTQPEWNECFDILVFDKSSQKVEFQVFDSDLTKQDGLLGNAVLNISKLPNNQKVPKILQLCDVEKGSLHISVEFVPIITANVRKSKKQSNLTQDELDAVSDVLFDHDMGEITSSMLDEDILLPRTSSVSTFDDEDHFSEFRNSVTTESHNARISEFRNSAIPESQSVAGDSVSRNSERSQQSKRSLRILKMQSETVIDAVHVTKGILTISNIRGRKLKSVSNRYFDNTFRPFVIFSVGSVVKETKYLKNNADPFFPETFTFILRNPEDEVLRVKVMEKNKYSSSTMIGFLQLALSELIDKSEPTEEREYMLKGDNQEGFLGFKMTWAFSDN